MNENNEILECIYKAANIGRISAENLLKALKDKDNKIKEIIEEINKQYEKYEKESSKLLKKNKVEPKGTNVMMDMINKMEIKKEVKNDNSDSSIASTLIEGLTMGNIEMEKRISSYENKIDKKNINIAKNFKIFGEEYIEKLKKYL